jgi:hypothetical protein
VCVCERERERERQADRHRESERGRKALYPKTHRMAEIHAVYVFCAIYTTYKYNLTWCAPERASNLSYWLAGWQVDCCRSIK